MNFKEKSRQFYKRLKYLRFHDFTAIFSAIGAFFVAPVFKQFHRNIWLICERRTDARDNGYWFFKYICENHPEIEAVYAIDINSPDYSKVEKLGKVIQFGSFSHWLYYFAASKNISSQKEGKPNAAICFMLEVYLGFRKNRVFLQHGIVQSDLKWLYYDLTKINLFLCSTQREYEYIVTNFGYPFGTVQLTGLCRYDSLLDNCQPKRQILVMPTMRYWLSNVSSDTEKYEKSPLFEDSQYYHVWQSFLNNNKLIDLLERYDVGLIFYPHAALQNKIQYFHSNNSKIIIADSSQYDVQALLKESSLMITDYSSVHFDFAYMNKPVLYYQFDYDRFREAQYQEGYFSYKEDGFGVVTEDLEFLLCELETYLIRDFANPEQYQKRIDLFFTYRDANNCVRVYNAICANEKSRSRVKL